MLARLRAVISLAKTRNTNRPRNNKRSRRTSKIWQLPRSRLRPLVKMTVAAPVAVVGTALSATRAAGLAVGTATASTKTSAEYTVSAKADAGNGKGIRSLTETSVLKGRTILSERTAPRGITRIVQVVSAMIRRVKRSVGISRLVKMKARTVAAGVAVLTARCQGLIVKMTETGSADPAVNDPGRAPVIAHHPGIALHLAATAVAVAAGAMIANTAVGRAAVAVKTATPGGALPGRHPAKRTMAWGATCPANAKSLPARECGHWQLQPIAAAATWIRTPLCDPVAP